MNSIVEANASYPFSDIKIKTPKALQGGTYSAKLELNNNPIVIQTPKCKTKNGIHTTVKQIYCDLLMNEDHIEFIKWLRLLQERVRQLIFENSENWFHEAPTLDEIEYNWNDSIRTYKSVNYLIRTFIHKSKNINNISLQIFDSDENEVSHNELDSNKNIIGIIEIVGLKFSSNSFHLEICLRQIMVLKEKPLFGKCLIKINSNHSTDKINMDMKAKEQVKNKDNLFDNKDICNNDLHGLNQITDSLDETESIAKHQNDKTISLEKPDDAGNKLNTNDIDDTNSIIDAGNNDTINNELKKDVKTKTIEKDNQKNNSITTPTSTETNKFLNIENVDKNKVLSKTQDNNDKSFVNENLEEMNKENDDSIETTNNIENLEETITIFQKKSEGQDDLEEISLEIDETSPLTLKNPNEVYLDIYKSAREKAKKAKNDAIKAYLEAKRIKELYLLDVVDTSDEESEDEEELFSEN